MKLIKVLLLTMSLIFVFSCTTTGTSNVSNEKDDTVIIDDVEQKMVEVEVEETIYYPLIEKSYYGDGQIDTITNYTYDATYKIQKSVQTNEQGEVLESQIYQYDDELLVKRLNYGFANSLNSYSVFTYDSNGNLITETMYDSNDKVQSISEFDYKDNLIVNWRTLSGNGGVLALTTYVYNKNSQLVKIEIRDAGNSIDGIISKKYIDGLLVSEEILDSKGNTEKTTSYTYNNNLLTEVIYMDSKGKKSRSESYEYSDSKPVADKVIQHYKSGAVEAYKEIEYNSYLAKSIMKVKE